jgi:hypothetical protein
LRRHHFADPRRCLVTLSHDFVGPLVAPSEVKSGVHVVLNRRKTKKNLGKCPTTGKVRFRDDVEAKSALQRAKSQRKQSAETGSQTRRHEARTYRCKDCGGWHLTSNERWTP